MANAEGVSPTSNISKRIRRLNLVIVLGFFVLGVGMVYWSAIQNRSILVREDNPRIVDREIAIERGTIYSTNGEVLAETVTRDGETKRIYSNGGGPAVGYYSIRHGLSGAEEEFDPILRGNSGDYWTDFWNYELLNQPRIGQDIRLTLDERWQRAADKLMGENRGAVLLISLPDKAARAMVSKPGYDPNRLDDDFDVLIADSDAPLLNRVIQGQYQPGMTLQPFIVAGAVELGIIDLEAAVKDAERPVKVNGDYIGCIPDTTEVIDWKGVVAEACPGPIQEIGNNIGEVSLAKLFLDFGLLDVSQAPSSEEEEAIEDLALSVIGYDKLSVNPMKLGLALAALGSDGMFTGPLQVDAVQDQLGIWQSPENDLSGFPAVSPETAQEVRDLLAVDRGIAEINTAVISGPESTNNSWYLALAPASDPLYAVVVVIEDSSELGASKRVGQSLLLNILDPADS